jgi:hypothetical protein
MAEFCRDMWGGINIVLNIVTCMCDCRRGSDHFNTQLVTTPNFTRSTIADLHTSQVTRAKCLRRSVCLGIKHPSRAYDQIFISHTVAGLLMWGALSDERTGLSFAIAAGPRQRSHSWVRVPWDLRPYFTVSDSRLPFSSTPTTRRATVEVFDPASTRGAVELFLLQLSSSYV